MKYLPFLLIILVLSCKNSDQKTHQSDRYANIGDAKARAVIQSAIEAAGGIDRWEAIKRLQYTKDFSLLLESGEVEKTFKQVHDYQYQPLKIEIRSEENGQNIRTVLKNGKYTRTVHDSLMELSQEALAKAVNTSTYVVSMPFKLLDPGANITYEGHDTLVDGREVDVLRVAYNADQYDNHSTSDVWKYYFDKEGRIVDHWVKNGDHFSWIEKLSDVKVGSILFNQKRQSDRPDSLNNRLFLRAKYLYDNYVLE